MDDSLNYRRLAPGLAALVSLLMTTLTLPIQALATDPVTLTAADGVKVFGDYWPTSDPRAPLILAFHQAGSNRAEYEQIAARLNKSGFSVLTVDQRSGGAGFGGRNRTVTVLGRSASYDEALLDLEAALAWGGARAKGAPVLVWGSSYSAALVFLLAAKHPGEISGLLAFSPGEYLSKPDEVRTAAKKVRVPVFVDQAMDAEEVEQSRKILRATASTDKTQFVATRGGVHGSATLRADRNAAGLEENWGAVLQFLQKFRPTN